MVPRPTRGVHRRQHLPHECYHANQQRCKYMTQVAAFLDAHAGLPGVNGRTLSSGIMRGGFQNAFPMFVLENGDLRLRADLRRFVQRGDVNAHYLRFEERLHEFDRLSYAEKVTRYELFRQMVALHEEAEPPQE